MEELMYITTGRWQATQEQLAEMKRKHEEAIARERAARSKLNRWQGMLQAALGNVGQATKEMQEELKEDKGE